VECHIVVAGMVAADTVAAVAEHIPIVTADTVVAAVAEHIPIHKVVGHAPLGTTAVAQMAAVHRMVARIGPVTTQTLVDLDRSSWIIPL
jgi:hypothetical protein